MAETGKPTAGCEWPIMGACGPAAYGRLTAGPLSAATHDKQPLARLSRSMIGQRPLTLISAALACSTLAISGCKDRDINVHNDTKSTAKISIDLNDGRIYDTVVLKPEDDMIVRSGAGKLISVQIVPSSGLLVKCAAEKLSKATLPDAKAKTRKVISLKACLT
jgi:hypothetical protein